MTKPRVRWLRLHRYDEWAWIGRTKDDTNRYFIGADPVKLCLSEARRLFRLTRADEVRAKSAPIKVRVCGEVVRRASKQ